MAGETFKIGDVVQLKSGGPLMTVTAFKNTDAGPTVWCAWFQGTKQESGHFPVGAVELYREQPTFD